MPERFTNNPTLYKEELIAKLEKPNEITGYDFIFFYSIVSSFLTHVFCFFIFRNKTTGRLLILKRRLDPGTIISNYGIYFPDRVEFNEFIFELNAEDSLEINSLIQEGPAAPYPLQVIILDGSLFHIKNIRSQATDDFLWTHEDQLNSTAKQLVHYFDKLI